MNTESHRSDRIGWLRAAVLGVSLFRAWFRKPPLEQHQQTSASNGLT
jgi:hypothetical protein